MYAIRSYYGHPGATIIGDVKCSEVLFDGIAAAGGKSYNFV